MYNLYLVVLHTDIFSQGLADCFTESPNEQWTSSENEQLNVSKGSK